MDVGQASRLQAGLPPGWTRVRRDFQGSGFTHASDTRLLQGENLMSLRQVLRGQFGLLYPRVDLLFESIETMPQR
jgi:hypothetical protein